MHTRDDLPETVDQQATEMVVEEMAKVVWSVDRTDRLDCTLPGRYAASTVGQRLLKASPDAVHSPGRADPMKEANDG